MAIPKRAVFNMTVTPFKESGDLDEAALRRLLQWQAGAGVGVYLLSYGSGEGHLVDHEEMLRVYAVGAKELKGKAPIFAAGAGLGPSTRDFIKLAKEIAMTGVDAIQLHHPRPAYPGMVARPAEVERYFRDVLDAVVHPMVMSVHPMAVPGITPPTPQFAKQLVDTYPHLIGFNVSMLGSNYLKPLKDAVGHRASVWGLGSLEALTLGLDGVLTSTVTPRLSASIFEDYKAGREKEVFRKAALQMKLGQVIGKYGNPRGPKAAWNILGLPGGYLRLPYLELDEAARADIARVLEELEIKKIEGITG